MEKITLQPSYSARQKCRTYLSGEMLFQVRNVQFLLFTARLRNPSLLYQLQDARPAQESHFRIAPFTEKMLQVNHALMSNPNQQDTTV